MGHRPGRPRLPRDPPDRDQGDDGLTAALPIHEFAALGASLCRALTGLIAVEPAGHLGAFAFNRARQAFAVVLLALCVLASGSWRQLDTGNVGPLLVSGLLGIFLGDTLLFATLNRLVPRRAGVVFALHAPIAAVIGWLLLGESLPLGATVGIALAVGGVLLAILSGTARGPAHRWEAATGPLRIGVALGLGAAAGQALGAIVARPLMAAGLDPFAASMLRGGFAALCLTVLVQLPITAVRLRAPLTWRVAALTALNGFLGLGVGMNPPAPRALGRAGRRRLDAFGDLAGAGPADALGAHRRAPRCRRLDGRGAGHGRIGAYLPQLAGWSAAPLAAACRTMIAEAP